ncbi:FAD-binding oxidoreductase [Salmonella enterica]|nr:FAD-binding oxidoreductase [Salmonella enterica]EKC2597425.1 FAD-binding oxidoreductase [Salmonella enterica]EMD3507978.1 FAD-binding oxidoreductase [Salmonella enterica]EMD4682142.1 FAD-binding oxidoreductase [Salmonella enterica]EMD4827699.1 FAD-binding oxidoreductase [Salmonella enterica]
MSHPRNVLSAAQIDHFSRTLSGRVISQLSPGYEPARRGLVWNGRPPERYPLLIVEAHSSTDVALAIDFARHNGLTVSARGTGHSYSAVFLSEGGLLLDLSNLNDIVVDRPAHRLSVGAGVRSGQIAAALAQEGLAFPVGHDTLVGIGGFLLGGGLGVNCAAWGGMSTSNILAAEIVNADGKTQCVSPWDNPDLFWALRGGGPGLPFIVTRYHLHCYNHPGTIASNSWLFRLSELPRLAQELDEVVFSLDHRLQIMVAIIPAPPELSSENGGRMVALTAIAFAEDADDARAMLASLPAFSGSMACTENPKMTFAEIQEQSKTLLVSQRFRTDNILCDDPGSAVEIIMRHLPAAPSPTSLSLIVWHGQKTVQNAAYSVSGRYFISTYAQWDLAEDDLVNAAWLKGFYDEMASIATGAYINEFDLEGRPGEADRCYSAAAFKRLRALRRSHDPNGVFYNPYVPFFP